MPKTHGSHGENKVKKRRMLSEHSRIFQENLKKDDIFVRMWISTLLIILQISIFPDGISVDKNPIMTKVKAL